MLSFYQDPKSDTPYLSFCLIARVLGCGLVSKTFSTIEANARMRPSVVSAGSLPCRKSATLSKADFVIEVVRLDAFNASHDRASRSVGAWRALTVRRPKRASTEASRCLVCWVAGLGWRRSLSLSLVLRGDWLEVYGRVPSAEG